MGNQRISILGITVICFVYFGIQFAFALQIANISAVYEMLGANANSIPILWLAAPLCGLIVQPFAGLLSDRCRSKFGRRKPYIFWGGLVTSISLLLMPLCTELSQIVILIWFFSIALNITMVPARAFIADQVVEAQLTLGYTVQGILCAFGSVIASFLPFMLNYIFDFKTGHNPNNIPAAVSLSFIIGAVVMVFAMFVTVFSKFKDNSNEHSVKSENNFFKDIYTEVFHMPRVMVKLSVVEFFAWLGMFGLFIYFPVFIPHNIFHSSPGHIAYNHGVEWAGACFTMYGIVQFIFSFFIPKLANKLTRKYTYFITMLLGACGLITMMFECSKYSVLVSMCLVGIMFAALNVIPFAIIGANVPKQRMGAFMGIFNIFITGPGVLATIIFGPIVQYCFDGNRAWGLTISGVCLIVAALFILWLDNEKNEKTTSNIE